jgi:hypothetical protein
MPINTSRKTSITIYIPNQLKERLDILAHIENKSLNKLICQLLLCSPDVPEMDKLKNSLIGGETPHNKTKHSLKYIESLKNNPNSSIP